MTTMMKRMLIAMPKHVAIANKGSFSTSSVKAGWFKDLGKPYVTVLRLHGIIAASTGGFSRSTKTLNIASAQSAIDEAFGPKKLRAVLLSINSPGGSAVQSELITDYIASKAKERNVTVTSFVEDVAASGGYWLACAGSNIYVSRSSLVGSIGAIAASFGFPELLGRMGIERRVHTAGKRKSILDPFRPEQEEDLVILQSMLREVHETFKDHVRTCRGDRIKASEEDHLFSGEFWVGERAVQLGLVDGIDNVNAFVRREFGDSVRLKVIKQPHSWKSLLGADAGSVQELITALEEQAIYGRFKMH